MQNEKLNIKESKEWFALYVNSRSEKKVTEALLQKNIEAYLPVVKSIRQWSDRKKILISPLLNGYVFVNISLLDKDRVLQTKGIVGFVKHCGVISKIRKVEIDRLKQLVELGYQIEASGLEHKHTEGDKVVITSGVLKDLEGFVLDTKEGKYIEIILETIGQSIRVKLPKETLKFLNV